MLGSIIGDLAAWTYENDGGAFFTDLVSPNAVLSKYGKTALDIAIHIASGNMDSFSPALVLEDDMDHGRQILIQSIQTAWSDDNVWQCIEKAEKVRTYACGKQGMYFVHIAVHAIHCLRNGATKGDLDKMEGCFTFKLPLEAAHGQGFPAKDILAYLGWAKEALDESWDFTSAIHRASYKPGDRHFLFAVVGALAEAMYGCKYRLLKSQYTKEPYKLIPWPDDISGDLARIAAYDFDHRHFFPKNNAKTNSEKLIWKPYGSGKAQAIRSSLADIIRKGFETGPEDLYGFYLENGWEYVYGNGRQFARFRMVEADNGMFRILNLQSHDDALVAVDRAIQLANMSAFMRLP